MVNNLRPWHVLLVTLSGWVNQHQQLVIDYLQEENRVLREQLGRRRVVSNYWIDTESELVARLSPCHGDPESRFEVR